MALSSPLTVIGMVNGMIGGLVLILPVDAMHAGFALSVIIILVTGAFSFYSCYLCVIHLGDQKDLDYAMYVHFNKSLVIKIIYDITVFSNLLLISFLYFELICVQWQNMIDSESIANPLSNAFVLFFLVFLLKYFQFGASVMAYGIISIIGYLIFLIWVISAAPSGNNQWVAFGSGQISLAAAMGGAFSIQTFFIPVLKQNPHQKKYVFFTGLAYVIGSSAYIYIACLGTLGIINRSPIISDPQDIEDFFGPKEFQLKIIQSIYLIHLYSVFPEFTLISLKRLFSIFKIKETKQGRIPIPEIIYAIIFIAICLTIRLVGVGINQIVNLNGSVIGFFFIYFLPALLHIRCLYFAKNKITFQEKSRLDEQNKIKRQQMSTLQGQTELKARYDSYVPDLKTVLIKNEKNLQMNETTTRPISKSQLPHNYNSKSADEEQIDQQEQQKPYFVCNCKQQKSLILKIVQMILLLSMIGIGAFILVNGVMTV